MKKHRTYLVILGISGAIFLLVLMIRLLPAVRALELKTIDWRFHWRGVESVEDSPIVIVSIDDQSFQSLPDRWPWPRYYYAHVIENLTRAGARVIGLDVMLDIPDRYGFESDQKLAEAIRHSGKVVLTGKIEERSSAGRYRNFQFVVKPIPALLAADSTWGTIAIKADADGIYRRYFVVQPAEDGLYPSFGLQIVKKYLDIPRDEPVQVHSGGISLKSLFVPLFSDGLMMINFAGPAQTFPYYSFESVIDDEDFDLADDADLNYFSTTLLPEGVFKDKIVLIGSTVPELHDNFPTPFLTFQDTEGRFQEAEMPGVEIHANAIRTMLTGRYFRPFPHTLYLILLFALIVLTYFIVFRVSTLWGIVITLGLILLYNILQFFLFAGPRIIMEMGAPTTALFLSFVASNLHQYIITQREKKMIVGAFARFVPEKVVKELLQHPEKLQLGGEERFLTVLFIDLANFTSTSEKLKPAELVNLINYYLTEMTDIILKYDGIIDKYEGDAIMAEFGAPVYFEDHALKACHAALEMNRRLKQLDLSRFKGVVNQLSCRIGINSGNMIVGNMGSRNVFDYTVMGDSVNLASRLEGANKAYGTSIMISEETNNLVKEEFITRELDLIRVKGRQQPVKVFELIAWRKEKIPENLTAMLPVFHTGLRYYQHQEWKKAVECFRYCLEVVPDDGPSRVFLKRIKYFLHNPPPSDWDGVYTMQSK